MNARTADISKFCANLVFRVRAGGLLRAEAQIEGGRTPVSVYFTVQGVASDLCVTVSNGFDVQDPRFRMGRAFAKTRDAAAAQALTEFLT